MRWQATVLILLVGVGLAVSARLLQSPYLVAGIAIVLAFLLGILLEAGPFRIGAVLIAPVAVSSLLLTGGDSPTAFGFVLLVNAATMLVLGLAAAAGALLTTGDCHADSIRRDN